MAYVYIFPENFQHLCSILNREFPDLWRKVGYKFLHEPVEAIAIMNEELDTFTLPELTIAECADTWLRALEKKRQLVILTNFDAGNKIEN